MAELEVDKLRREIDSLKKKGSEGNPEELSQAINSLIRIFAEASDDLKMDTHDSVLVGQKLDAIVQRLERIEIQNEKIAKGIVALADMVEELSMSKGVPRELSRPVPRAQPSFAPLPSAGPKPLPTYNLPRDEKKSSFLNFKM